MNLDESRLSQHDLEETLAGDDMLNDFGDDFGDGDILIGVEGAVEESDDDDDALEVLASPPKARGRQRGKAKARKVLVGGVVDASKLETPKAQAKAWEKLASFIEKADVVVPYSPMGVLEVSTVISHAKFGVGVVVNLESPQKAMVLFEDQVRRLVCNRGAPRRSAASVLAAMA